jgi:ABC-2 type transport system permease protein
VAAYVVTLLVRLHHDEAQGTLEPLLGTSVSRLRWLGAYGINALVGALILMMVFALAMALTGGQVVGDTASLLGELIGAALVQLPAIAALGAAVVAAVMFVPRWSAGLSWALVVLAIFVGPMFGPSLQLPTWLMDLSPFTYVPNAPAVPVSPAPVLGLALACVLLAAAAVIWLRRRDLALPA